MAAANDFDDSFADGPPKAPVLLAAASIADFDDSFADGPPKAKLADQKPAIRSQPIRSPPKAKLADQKPAKREEAAVNEKCEAKVAEEKSAKEADPFTVFVGGISYKCPEEQVELDFSEHGEITKFRFLTDYDGNSRGIAFVTYDNMESVAKALKQDGDDYWGRTLKVNMAFDKEKGEAKSGRQGPNNLRVWIGGLPKDFDEASLRKEFAECGEIDDVTMPKDEQGKSRDFAFIAFKDKEAVEKALNFDGSKFGDNFAVKMQANKDQQHDGDTEDGECLEVFVKGLSENTTVEALKKHFEGCGDVKTVRLPKNDDAKVKGFAFVTFGDSEAANKAIELDEKEFGDSGAIEVRLASSKGKGKGKEDGEECLEVFVKGLSEKTTAEALRKHFEACGVIKNVKLPKDDNDEVKGFAFVAFEDSGATSKAIELDGKEFGDSGAIEVRLAKQKGKGKGKDKGKDKGKGKSKGKGKGKGKGKKK